MSVLLFLMSVESRLCAGGPAFAAWRDFSDGPDGALSRDSLT